MASSLQTCFILYMLESRTFLHSQALLLDPSFASKITCEIQKAISKRTNLLCSSGLVRKPNDVCARSFQGAPNFVHYL
ncbi:hypothetical protein BC940DRAFT_310670 [Gongronella butleri]|nr:hypothetical protein BC940DRAFT_310670 [Gongronella butleri]